MTVTHRYRSHHGRQSSRSLKEQPHNRCASHGHYSSLPKGGERKTIQLNEGQNNGGTPNMMDGELSLGKNSGDDN